MDESVFGAIVKQQQARQKNCEATAGSTKGGQNMIKIVLMLCIIIPS
jgi:hypothetical protein